MKKMELEKGDYRITITDTPASRIPQQGIIGYGAGKICDKGNKPIALIVLCDQYVKEDNMRELVYSLKEGRMPWIVLTAEFLNKLQTNFEKYSFALYHELGHILDIKDIKGKTTEGNIRDRLAAILAGHVVGDEARADAFAVKYAGAENAVMTFQRLKRERERDDRKKGVLGGWANLLALHEYDLRIEAAKEMGDGPINQGNDVPSMGIPTKPMYVMSLARIPATEIIRTTKTEEDRIVGEFRDMLSGEVPARFLLSDERAKRDNREAPYAIPGQPPLIVFTGAFLKRLQKEEPVARYRVYEELWHIIDKDSSKSKEQAGIGNGCDVDDFAVLHMGIDNVMVALKKLKDRRKAEDQAKGAIGQPEHALAMREFASRIKELQELRRKHEDLCK